MQRLIWCKVAENATLDLHVLVYSQVPPREISVRGPGKIVEYMSRIHGADAACTLKAAGTEPNYTMQEIDMWRFPKEANPKAINDPVSASYPLMPVAHHIICMQSEYYATTCTLDKAVQPGHHQEDFKVGAHVIT